MGSVYGSIGPALDVTLIVRRIETALDRLLEKRSLLNAETKCKAVDGNPDVC